MKQVITVWNKSGDSTFEKNVPLEFNGERNRRLGSICVFDVIFLEGLSLLSSSYRERLSALGYVLHDIGKLYQQLKERYAALARFGDYERNCFLRWLAIREFCGEEPFAHYDADIVFNATPEEIEKDFSGLTFILQGCPAYARISDPAWLNIYAAELDLFVADIETYSFEAWQQRIGFASTVREKNGALWNRPILSSDQDLLQFLTLSGRLPQDGADTLNERCTTALFQNPLVIGSDIQLPLPLWYERRHGIDYINDRKVAFWHMQGGFCSYLGYATFCTQFGSHARISWSRNERTLSYMTYRALSKFSSAYKRGELIRRYFGNSEDLSFLLNGRRFWQEDVFV